MEIIINKIKESRINQLDENNIQFGRLYSDHMLVADYYDGKWQSCEILPFQNISLNPATTFIHYGQSIFEGVKAYKSKEGKINVFRPEKNWERMNVSAQRIAMPDIPSEIFLDGLKKLLEIDQKWVPGTKESSLYIRPFLFATDEFIGVKPAERFKFMIITSPAGPYYSQPVKIFIQKKYVRAFPGGVGFTKAAGNYGAAMEPMKEIRELGYDQILWVDGVEHKYTQEIGTMNVFFVVNGKVITPDLKQGTILAGVTRDSVIQLLKDKGIEVEERRFSVDELKEAIQNGALTEVFGTGTAASIAPIGRLTSEEFDFELPNSESGEIASWLKTTLNNIRYAESEDTKNWLFSII